MREARRIPNQKIENLLNLALSATEEERAKSLELDVGYNPIDREWDLIVKYSGTISCISKLAVKVVELINEYAIVTIKESNIEALAMCEEVEYIEKPKRLFFQTEYGKRVSCITSVKEDSPFLTGKDVFLGIIDSGIDVMHPLFQTKDGRSRIRNLWDQVLDEYFDQEMITNGNTSSRDTSGHGTAVAGVAASVASDSELIVVKLGLPKQDGFPRTTEVMLALNYIVEKALEYRKPVAINLSFGNTYGAHDGSSLLERFIDDIANLWKSVIVIGTGNEGTASGHVSGVIRTGEQKIIELAVQENEPTVNVQIWKSYVDDIDISLITPSGVTIGPINQVLGSQRVRVGETEILIYYGEPSPYSSAQEIFIDFLPRRTTINSGIWKIVFTPKKIVSGEFGMWLPSENVLNSGTGFLFPNKNRTLTIPSTSIRSIAVGAYDARTFSYADFSGRGPSEETNLAKPDLVAPGVDILTAAVGGGSVIVSGTSFATPFVTGSAALLMEWGIVRKNDEFLYGEKVKAYLQKGAKPLPGYDEYPNPEVGYGALCLEDSLP